MRRPLGSAMAKPGVDGSGSTATSRNRGFAGEPLLFPPVIQRRDSDVPVCAELATALPALVDFVGQAQPLDMASLLLDAPFSRPPERALQQGLVGRLRFSWHAERPEGR